MIEGDVVYEKETRNENKYNIVETKWKKKRPNKRLHSRIKTSYLKYE